MRPQIKVSLLELRRTHKTARHVGIKNLANIPLSRNLFILNHKTGPLWPVRDRAVRTAGATSSSHCPVHESRRRAEHRTLHLGGLKALLSTHYSLTCSKLCNFLHLNFLFYKGNYYQMRMTGETTGRCLGTCGQEPQAHDCHSFYPVIYGPPPHTTWSQGSSPSAYSPSSSSQHSWFHCPSWASQKRCGP